MKLSEFENTAQTLYFNVFSREDRPSFIDLRLEGAVLFLFELPIASLLCDPGLLGLKLVLEVLRELLAVLWRILRLLLLVLLLASQVDLWSECANRFFLLLVL